MLRSIRTFLFLPLMLQVGAILPAQGQTEDMRTTIDNSLYNAVLMQHVNELGEVDYSSIKEDTRFAEYLDLLSATDPDALTDNEALAFWLNAYNVFTIKLVIDNYPVGSIKEITPLRIKGISLAFPKLNSPFEYNIAEISGRKYSLDDIEHGILRKKFDEPRVHFALVCASYSCPPLRGEAFEPSRLNEQLNEQARIFLTDALKNKIDPANKEIYLSKIFKWFKSDFTKNGEGSTRSLQEYLAQFFEGKTREMLENNAFRVKYLKYNWTLNDVGSFNN